jgi:signal recognition particle subunit SRP54
VILLEADVNLQVVKDFCETIKEKALKLELSKALSPGQQVIKLVSDGLTELLGGTNSKLNYRPGGRMTTLLLLGLQGSGKTTTCGKLARLIKKQGRHPALLPLDVYRPAAAKQLQVLGRKLGVPVYEYDLERKDVLNLFEEGRRFAKERNADTIICDTAGRLQIDDVMVQEVADLKRVSDPDETLLVIDATIGQEAVNVATTFDEKVGVSGLIFTKLDGDARGGGALSVRQVTGKPIKFVGVGEKLEDLEAFHPDRMAQRILGLGDMLTLIEKAQEQFDVSEAEKLQEKIKKKSFDLDDFLKQIDKMQGMGPVENILKMIPGMPKVKGKIEVQDKEINRAKAIIQAMTKAERADPALMNASRKKRVAAGSGVSVMEVNQLLSQFEQARRLMTGFIQTQEKMQANRSKRKGSSGKKGVFTGLT